jgi:hypothetical protein
MKVTLKPTSGTAEANLERAKHEIDRVLGFRGNVIGVAVNGAKLTVSFNINPKWDLLPEQRVSYLKEWISVKVRGVFKVVSVSEEGA